MARHEREILERSVHAVAEQAAKADDLVYEALAVGLANPIVIYAKMLRLELFKVKGDRERELGTLVHNCTACGIEVHWIRGVSIADPGHCGHARPAPHGEPVV